MREDFLVQKAVARMQGELGLEVHARPGELLLDRVTEGVSKPGRTGPDLPWRLPVESRKNGLQYSPLIYMYLTHL